MVGTIFTNHEVRVGVIAPVKVSMMHVVSVIQFAPKSFLCDEDVTQYPLAVNTYPPIS